MALWVVAAWLTRDIVARTFPDRNPAWPPLAVAVVFTAQFFLNNFNLVQVNEVIFVLVLLGIRASLGGRDAEAAVWFVVATALKITPVFFVIWLLVRGRRRALVTVPPAALACLLVPLLLRGPATGAAELREYYHSFLEGPRHGQVGTGDQNLGGMGYRMLRPAAPREGRGGRAVGAHGGVGRDGARPVRQDGLLLHRRLQRDRLDDGAVIRGERRPVAPRVRGRARVTPVSVVVPCFNEAGRLPVERFERGLAELPDRAFVFVDDGRPDATPPM